MTDDFQGVHIDRSGERVRPKGYGVHRPAASAGHLTSGEDDSVNQLADLRHTTQPLVRRRKALLESREDEDPILAGKRGPDGLLPSEDELRAWIDIGDLIRAQSEDNTLPVQW
jgi:hypothetical protein